MASLRPLDVRSNRRLEWTPYPTITLKAAALMQLLAENQPFVDGNKRIAWICGQIFLQLRGYTMRATDKEALHLFVDCIANGMAVGDLAIWIESHLSPSKPPAA